MVFVETVEFITFHLHAAKRGDYNYDSSEEENISHALLQMSLTICIGIGCMVSKWGCRHAPDIKTHLQGRHEIDPGWQIKHHLFMRQPFRSRQSKLSPFDY